MEILLTTQDPQQRPNGDTKQIGAPTKMGNQGKGSIGKFFRAVAPMSSNSIRQQASLPSLRRTNTTA